VINGPWYIRIVLCDRKQIPTIVRLKYFLR
jgi:hypothetical protein